MPKRSGVWAAAAMAFAVFVLAGLRILSILTDDRENRTAVSEVREIFTSAVAESDVTESAVTESAVAESGATGRPSTMPQNIRSPLDRLRDINPDIVGWIRIPGTSIDYPVVQGRDNAFYLTHDVKRQENRNGSIFLDYRNIPGADRHLVLYGHNMKNGTMFAELLRYESRSFLARHPVVELTLLGDQTRWEIFSVHFTDVRHDYIRVDFTGDDDFKAFVDDLASRSLHPARVRPNENDTILTLSTCSARGEDSRFAVHARLLR
ncbi:MAG: SrtB family sortase [Candidatus Reconcilbacillus cellulovorans]|uniref:SrtB family sortase n=1 Tax=Candidatus Reconcilbacillus cellulovorans TaxID=1906605 RepID=A0A2A6E0H3_9BACL|nr:MAG: SrtB family sortase [Candidatus Reconcilbacillus cellulovorans]